MSEDLQKYRRFCERMRTVARRGSERQRQALAWDRDGVPYKEIGRRLGVSTRRAYELCELARNAEDWNRAHGTQEPGVHISIEQ